MMGFHKVEQDGYILGVAKTHGRGNITEGEYETLTTVLRARPAAPEGFGCRLKTDLTWELYELPQREML